MFCELSVLHSNPTQPGDLEVSTCLAPMRQHFTTINCFGSRWSRAKSVLRAVCLGYVTNLTAKAWEKAVQELGKMSAKIAWHSPRTLRYASDHLQRGKYFKLTSYKTRVFV